MCIGQCVCICVSVQVYMYVNCVIMYKCEMELNRIRVWPREMFFKCIFDLYVELCTKEKWSVLIRMLSFN